MMTNHQAEKQLRQAADVVISNLPTIDVADVMQASARAALGELVARMLDHFECVAFSSTPSAVERATLQYLNRVVELMADAHHLLRPSERTFSRSHLVSHILRALAESHARTLSTWGSRDPDSTLRGMLSDSIRTELLGLEAAELAGADVEVPIRVLSDTKDMLGRHAPLNVVGTLEEHGEHEALAIYRWESGHIHGGTAEMMARGRSASFRDAVVDVGLNPASLWRVGQLTWATYGLGLRAVSLMAQRVRLPIDVLVEADQLLRVTVHSAAARIAGADEPPGPPYSSFSFPLGDSPGQNGGDSE